MMPKSITHLSQMNVLMDSLNSLDISSQNQGIYHLNLGMQVTSGSLYNPINVKYGVCLALHISIKYFENQLHEKICFYIHYMGHFLTVSVISNPNYPWGNVCTHIPLSWHWLTIHILPVGLRNSFIALILYSSCSSSSFSSCWSDSSLSSDRFSLGTRVSWLATEGVKWWLLMCARWKTWMRLMFQLREEKKEAK